MRVLAEVHARAAAAARLATGASMVTILMRWGARTAAAGLAEMDDMDEDLFYEGGGQSMQQLLAGLVRADVEAGIA